VAPPPGGEDAVHGPLWIVLCAGLAFLLGGSAVVTRAMVPGDIPQGDLPPDAPRWIHVTQYALGVAVMACLALVGTWIAFGAGTRSFSVSAPFFETSGGGEMFGRVVFGIGAALTCLGAIAFAVGGARRILRRGKA
jgi:hypothetical protein